MVGIIALVGRSRSGKDTAARVLVGAYGGRISRLSAPVKAAACALFGLCSESVEGPDKDLPHPACAALGDGATPRTALVWLTEVCRSRMGADFFSRRVFYVASRQPCATVIPDVRYPEDAEAARRHGGLVLKIVRPAEAGGTAHPWEDCIDGIVGDVVIVNDGTEVELEQKVLSAVEEHVVAPWRGTSSPTKSR